MDYAFLKDIPGAIPKPEPRKKLKRREQAAELDRIHRVRMFITGRDRDWCRCCCFRRMESMHEIKGRGASGLGSKAVNPRNSIAACGDGVRGCHGFMQRNEIKVDVLDKRVGANGTLMLIPQTAEAAAWMRVTLGLALESKPGSQRDER